MKRFLSFLLFGGLLGAVLITWFAPSVLSWYFTPPAEVAISCKQAVDWSLKTYRECMLGGAIMGAIVGSILFFAWQSRKKNPAPIETPAR